MGNDYGKPKDVYGENRYAFTSHADSAFDVCFQNTITGNGTPLDSLIGFGIS
jgi:p24 family protein delta-1